MSDETPGMSQTFGRKLTECVPRYVSHSVGGSMFFLAYAMAQAGVITFAIVLTIEAYFTGMSLLYIQEMVKQHPKFGIEHNNYFLVIENNLSKKMRHLVRVLFIIDVINCTAFYYKIIQTLLEALIFKDYVLPRSRTGTTIVTFALTTIFLIGMEYGQKYAQKSTVPAAEVNIKQSKVGIIVLDSNNSSNKEEQINMSAVAGEMNNFDRKRPVLLLLFMLLFFSTITVSYDTHNSDGLKLLSNLTMECPGIENPVEWANINVQIFTVVAITIYALKNYTIMLPVCVEELSYDSAEFRKIIFRSGLILVILYMSFSLSVYLTFGESVPSLFLTGYGKNIVGVPLVCIALAMTGNAMLLRIIACFKLMQVLFSDNDTENVFWLVVIFSVFASLIVALVVPNVVYLVIFAGAFTCNLLIIILPCIAYIKFKWYEDRTGPKTIMALCNLYWHTILLFSSPIALYYLEPSVGAGCRKILNSYWL